MGTGRVVTLVAETLAVVAVAIQFLLPGGTVVTVTVADKALGLPIRWVVPLVLIVVAGALSLAGLLTMYWRLSHVQ